MFIKKNCEDYEIQIIIEDGISKKEILNRFIITHKTFNGEVHKIENAIIDRDKNIIYTGDGKVVKESLYLAHNPSRQIFFDGDEINSENGYLICGNCGISYYHFLFQILPNYIFLDEKLNKNNIKYQIITNHKHNFLKVLNNNYNFYNIINKYEKFSKIYYSNFLYAAPCATSTVQELLMKKFINNYKLEKDVSIKYNQYIYIYISRKDSEKRKFENEDFLINYLKDKNFEILELSKYSLHEQAMILNNAKVVIGIHGAGLTNIVFSKKCTIIEIFDYSYINLCFFEISYYLGCEYKAIVCKDRYINQEFIIHAIDRLLALC